jgi:nitrogenase-stabilizing/protective protein
VDLLELDGGALYFERPLQPQTGYRRSGCGCGPLPRSRILIYFAKEQRPMSDTDFDLELQDLSSAEDFLDYFGIAYDPAVVQVNRLHILQRFHDYLADAGPPATDAERRELYRGLLQSAYHDFVVSDARTEKVFRVFTLGQPRRTAVPLSELTGALGAT